MNFMKLYIFGTCSGTEPMRNRHHTALAAEINRRIYWFDAGENCSYTAHLMGVDLLRVSDIFLSHTHMDHVGGLGNLLWNIRKISLMKRILPHYGNITIYTPNMESFDGILTVLKNTEGNYATEYKTLAKKVEDGTLLKNSDIEVLALHNHHLPKTQNGWESFSFCIKAEGKKIVYSGDVKEFEELSAFLEEGCDVLLMETGHHSAVDICKKILDNGYDIKEVCFLHHGRGILYDFEGQLAACQRIIPSVKFCNDGDIFSV